MVTEEPKLLLEIKVERRKYIRRFFWGMLTFVAAVGAAIALQRAESVDALDPTLLLVGQVVAVGVSAMLIVRGFFNLVRGLRRRDVKILIFDKGFVWATKDATNKYSWRQVKSYQDAYRRIALGRLTLFQSGHLRLKMSDDATYTLTPVHGNLRDIAQKISPLIADTTATKMSRALREGKAISVHPELKIMSKGILAKGEKLRWQDADIYTKRGQLIIARLSAGGEKKQVARYPTSQIRNLGGFLDIANMLIRNNQPERFGIKTQVGVTYVD